MRELRCARRQHGGSRAQVFHRLDLACFVLSALRQGIAMVPSLPPPRLHAGSVEGVMHMLGHKLCAVEVAAQPARNIFKVG